jgi:hypothetical protein
MAENKLIEVFQAIKTEEANKDRLNKLALRAIDKSSDKERSKLKDRKNAIEDEDDELQNILANPFNQFDENSTEITFKCTALEYSERLTENALKKIELAKDVAAWESFYRAKFE